MIFSRHLCSFIVLLLNNWSNPILNLCCFSWYDFTKPLRTTNFCSNDLTSRFRSITLANVHDLEHCTSWVIYQSIWKQIYYFLGGGSFWSGLLVLFLCWNCIESNPNKICSFGAVTQLLLFWGVSKDCAFVNTNKTGCLVYLKCDFLF